MLFIVLGCFHPKRNSKITEAQNAYFSLSQNLVSSNLLRHFNAEYNSTYIRLFRYTFVSVEQHNVLTQGITISTHHRIHCV